MEQFYMQPTNCIYRDILLKSTNWDDAIKEVKNTQIYMTTKLPLKIRNRRGIDDYVEVYCGKLRKDMSFEELRDDNVYRKIY